MKVVITIDNFHPDKWYLEHYLARELTRMGHEVHVFTFTQAKDQCEHSVDFDFKVHRLPYVATITPFHLPSPWAIAYISKFVQHEKPHIIHCQPLFSPLSLVFFGCQFIGHYELVGSLITGQYTVNSVASTLKYFITKFVIEKFIIRRSRMIFVKSEGLRRALQHLFKLGRQEIYVVPLGADAEVFCHNELTRFDTRTRLGISPEDVVVICSGTLYPAKRTDDLIKAIAPIIRENSKVKLFILGSGKESYFEYLNVLCNQLGISENVLFHPLVSRLEIPAIFDASDITVWPSGGSISMIEAASIGLPLISMKSPIEAYALSNDNGFFFQPGNIKELRRLLKVLIDDKGLRDEMGHKSRELVEKKLNWRSIALECLNHYRQALESY